MLEHERADNSITQAAGVFSNCGPGVNTYELQYNCKGPACSVINGFQNVKCNTDGGTMSCSNDVKCPVGVSSYMSNFTFTQNEGDPWKPSSQNERDSWVHQEQHVMLPSCAKFSLTSDGTKEGTKVDDSGKADEKLCPNVQETPSPTAGVGLAKKTSSTGRPLAGATSRPDAAQSNTGSRRSAPKNMLFITFLVGLMILLPGTQASVVNDRRYEFLVRVRDVSDKVRAFAEDFSADLAEKANAQGQNGEVFAHNLVADVISSVCDAYFSGQDPGNFSPTIVEGCVKSIYGGERLPQAAGQFFAVFGASLLCDYVVSEAYPVAQDFLPDGCEGLQDLARKIAPKATVAPSAAPASPLPASDQVSIAQPSNALPSNSPPSNVPTADKTLSDAPTSGVVPSNAPASNAPASDAPASSTIASDVPNPGVVPLNEPASNVPTLNIPTVNAASSLAPTMNAAPSSIVPTNIAPSDAPPSNTLQSNAPPSIGSALTAISVSNQFPLLSTVALASISRIFEVKIHFGTI
ncbi:Nn.00g037720.m01.CDS01 [Neocucurbitaria sp. VM-36]